MKFSRKFTLFLIYPVISVCLLSCSGKLDPEPLSLNVKQNLALLQTDPQFLIYINFKKMRETDFWKTFISDSLFDAERNFGSFFYNLKQVTGAGINDGIDEVYFSNSWIGDNAMVIKGVFDRKKVYEYVSSDSMYKKIDYPNGFIVFRQTETNFTFYFRDDFTVYASNYLKLIENSFGLTDTSYSGVLTNKELMKEIEKIKYKEHLWMITNQKLFIRGIFENFSEGGKGFSSAQDTLLTDEDTSSVSSGNLYDVYKSIKSVSFSMKMKDDLEIVMQNECEDENSAKEFKNRAEAIMALAKLSSSFTRKPSPVIRLLDKVRSDQYDRTVLFRIKLDEKDIAQIRANKIF
ncbi:MAG: hypothetical protein N2510_09720 [Ignavibacteria bacterium]|nr:hypothetical protein [Ignavibacteria bacterium]